jgi:hypothetical protein
LGYADKNKNMYFMCVEGGDAVDAQKVSNKI